EVLEHRLCLDSSFILSELPIPTHSGYNSYPADITSGPDGDLWFTESSPPGNQIGRIDPSTGNITEFSTFTTPISGRSPFAITSGPDGDVWFTENSGGQAGYSAKIARLDPSTGTVTEFGIPPSNGSASNGTAYSAGITTGPDGALWFTEELGGKIG